MRCLGSSHYMRRVLMIDSVPLMMSLAFRLSDCQSGELYVSKKKTRIYSHHMMQ